MDFRILGPLEVRDSSGSARRLARRKQRVLLAGLLLHAGQEIPTDQIIDWLWNERPPASAQQNLYSYLSDLRRQLDDGSGPRLHSHGGRHRLRVAPGELDVDGFEDIHAQ